MGVQISPEDRMRARKHLGYTNVSQVATFQLGIPAAIQTQYMIEGALDKLLPEALPEFASLLSKLDAVEESIEETMEDLEASTFGAIKLRDDHYEKLIQRYKYWRAALANLLAVMPNPYDFRFNGALGDAPSGGINIPVSN